MKRMTSEERYAALEEYFYTIESSKMSCTKRVSQWTTHCRILFNSYYFVYVQIWIMQRVAFMYHSTFGLRIPSYVQILLTRTQLILSLIACSSL